MTVDNNVAVVAVYAANDAIGDADIVAAAVVAVVVAQPSH